MSDNPPIIRTSERTAFGRCPQRWWLPGGLTEKDYVPRRSQRMHSGYWFGIGVHEALAEWYGDGYDRGREPWQTWVEWVGDEVRYIKANLTERDRSWFDEPVYEEAGELGVEMLRAYLREYGDDDHLEVIAIEQPFEVDLEVGGEIIATFSSRFDGAAIDHERGEIVLLEHKTAGAIKTAHLALDNQAGSYFAVATVVLREQGIIGPKDTIDAIMYNFLRKAKPDPRQRDDRGRYLNKDKSVSKRQPPRGFVREYIDRGPREVRTQLQRLTDEVVIMNKVRSGELPLTKTITDMCPYCPFFMMCVLHERGGSAWKEFKAAEYAVVDPYAENRKSAAE